MKRSSPFAPARNVGVAAMTLVATFPACDSRPLLLDPIVDATNARSWLVQKVCADDRGAHPIDPYDANDPYGDGGCPRGMIQRDILPTDSLPYYRFSNLIGQGGPSASAISLPVWDVNGDELVLMQRGFNPDGTLSFNTNYSHFDSYRIGSDWISQYGTRDSGSFNATFFGITGDAVTPYNGWVDFPATSFLGTSTTATTNRVLGASWEICGVSPPGAVPSIDDLNDASLQYALVTAFPFGSVGGVTKPMNTIAANHQSPPSVFPAGGDPGEGHAEIWYFTIPYGPTRWEVWSAAECLRPHDQNPNPAACDPAMPAGPDAYAGSNYCSCLPTPGHLGDCGDGPTTQQIAYMGSVYSYSRIVCRDWSNTIPIPSASPVAIPYWPSPQANLLSNFHFTEIDPLRPAARTLHWKVDDSLAVTSVQSTALYDTTRSGNPPSGCAKDAPIGVRYVTMLCGSADCASIAQDVPIASHPTVMTSGTYAFGITVRTESAGSIGPDVPTMPTGAIEVAVEQIDANGSVIAGAASARTSATIGPAVAMNVRSSVPATQQHLVDSVVLSSAYVGSTATIAFDPRTVSLRLRVTPQSPGVTFDIVDASLAKIGPPQK